MNQISFFAEITEQDLVIENRTEGQLTNKVAYDVGDTIQGSRKQEATLRKLFSEKKTKDLLMEIESESPVLAAELITKQELFSDFNLNSEKENGTEPRVARLKQLLIQRIDTAPKDSLDCRELFFRASQELMNKFNDLRTWEQVEPFVKDLGNILHNESYHNVSNLKEEIAQLKRTISNLEANGDTKVRIYFRLRRRLARYVEIHDYLEKAEGLKLSILGEKFINFFHNQASLNSTINATRKIKDWNDLLGKKSLERTAKVAKKPVWERALPERPDRNGGRLSTVKKPEELASHFGFPAIQFGHYVEDNSALEHIYRSSEALMDLSDILGVEDSSLSLNGRLKLAFGARGRGKALAHFERGQKVINFTKNKGTLGVLSHEYGHALDNFLYDFSHKFQNGQSHYLSELESLGDHLPSSIVEAMRELMKTIKEGNSVGTFENTNKPGVKPRETYLVRGVYMESEGLLHAMELLKERQDSELNSEKRLLEYYNTPYKNREIEKLEKKYQRNYKKLAMALAWLEEDKTGIRPPNIPYPSEMTRFYQNACTLDSGRKQYWSSDCELFARAFESYVEEILRKDGRRSDYLVAGTNDSLAYPVKEERVEIHKKVEDLVKELVVIL